MSKRPLDARTTDGEPCNLRHVEYSMMAPFAALSEQLMDSIFALSDSISQRRAEYYRIGGQHRAQVSENPDCIGHDAADRLANLEDDLCEMILSIRGLELWTITHGLVLGEANNGVLKVEEEGPEANREAQD